MIDAAHFSAFLARGAEPASHWLHPYSPDRDSSLHQFIFFLKPEVTTPKLGANLAGIVRIVEQALATFDVEVGAVRLLNGGYLSRHKVMDHHYGVLNQISLRGREAISAAAEENLVKLHGELIDRGVKVLGAHQFLQEQPGINELGLSLLSDNVGSQKLAGGTYALKVNVLGTDYIVLNAFHPYQLFPYYNPESGVIVLEGLSRTSWADLRGKLAGATNPAKAPEGSIRNTLLKHQQALRLPDVSPGANGIHLSAGPLEGMVELRRFFSDPGEELSYADTCFGRQLAEAGLTSEQIQHLAGNPVLPDDGTSVPAFDLTEEKDAAWACEHLARSLQ